MFSFLKRRRDLRTAASPQEPFARRIAAIYALGEGADPAAIRALGQIAAGPDDLNLRRTAMTRLTGMSSPDALRVLLGVLAKESTSATWIFMDACQGLYWKAATLRGIANEAVPALVATGRNILAWRRGTVGERTFQAKWLRDVREMIEKLGTPAARSASTELHDRLQGLRAGELRGLLKIALESGAFEDADGAIAEIAELGTAEARAALIEIRAQPSRYLDHQFETDNTDVETGYSPKLVTISRPSSELGEALGGEARARWDAAKPG